MKRARPLATAALAAALLSTARAEAQSPPAAPTSIAVGDWQLSPTLEVRARGEYWHDPPNMGGQQIDPGSQTQVKFQPVDDGGGVLERTRLGVGAERGAVKAQVTLQDARAWGSTPPTATIVSGSAPASLRLFEGYAEARTSAARPNYLRLGRQVVSWGEGRLLGGADWSPTARSLDALRGHLGLGSAWDFELLAAILDSTRPLGVAAGDAFSPSNAGDTLFGAMGSWAIAPLLHVQLYGLARAARGTAPAGLEARSFTAARASGETYTAALHLFGESEGWKWGAEGAYQLGHAAVLGVDRSAFAAAGSVARTFDRVLLTPTFRVAASYASGDDGSGSYKQFDPILPDVHVFHGAMDTFAWSNMWDASARARLVPWTDTSFMVEYRYAQLVEATGEWLDAYLSRVGHTPLNGAKDLGHEIDVAFGWSPWTMVDFGLGYSLFLEGDGAKAILSEAGRTTGPAHFGYLQAQVRVP